MVGGRHEEVLDDVVAAQLRAAHALAAAALGPVVVRAGPLGVAVTGDGDDDLLLGDEVFHVHVAVERQDLRAPLVAVLGDDLGELLGDDPALPLGRGEDVVVVGDLPLELGQLVDDPLPLQRGEPAQLQVEDGERLLLVDVEQRHQARARLVGRRRVADQRDDLVERVERLREAAVDVGLPLGLAPAGSGCAGRRPRSGGRPSSGRTCRG